MAGRHSCRFKIRFPLLEKGSGLGEGVAQSLRKERRGGSDINRKSGGGSD